EEALSATEPASVAMLSETSELAAAISRIDADDSSAELASTSTFSAMPLSDALICDSDAAVSSTAVTWRCTPAARSARVRPGRALLLVVGQAHLAELELEAAAQPVEVAERRAERVVLDAREGLREVAARQLPHRVLEDARAREQHDEEDRRQRSRGDGEGGA